MHCKAFKKRNARFECADCAAQQMTHICHHKEEVTQKQYIHANFSRAWLHSSRVHAPSVLKMTKDTPPPPAHRAHIRHHKNPGLIERTGTLLYVAFTFTPWAWRARAHIRAVSSRVMANRFASRHCAVVTHVQLSHHRDDRAQHNPRVNNNIQAQHQRTLPRDRGGETPLFQNARKSYTQYMLVYLGRRSGPRLRWGYAVFATGAHLYQIKQLLFINHWVKWFVRDAHW